MDPRFFLRNTINKSFDKTRFKWNYWISHQQSVLAGIFNNNFSSKKELALAFILDKGNKGWILDAICKEIANYFPGECDFFYDSYFPSNRNISTYSPQKISLPSAKVYFFAHYSYYAVCLKLFPQLWHKKCFIFYTHPKGLMSDEEFAFVMNQATKTICMSSQFANQLISCGVKAEKVTYLPGAADPDIFYPNDCLENETIGFCTACYPRKNPDRVLNIVKQLPHRNFVLLGKGWEKYEKFSQLMALTNFSYIQAPYSEYPKHYRTMKVFVSPANLEGGPIPLIEAMMCNVVPVASNTGFTADIIKHGENGFIFDIDSSTETVCALIEQAFALKSDIRETVKQLSWKNFSLSIQHIIQST